MNRDTSQWTVLKNLKDHLEEAVKEDRDQKAVLLSEEVREEMIISHLISHPAETIKITQQQMITKINGEQVVPLRMLQAITMLLLVHGTPMIMQPQLEVTTNNKNP